MTMLQITRAELEQIIANTAQRTAEQFAARLCAAEDRLLDKHDAAKHLGCSVSTIERMTRDGTIPSHKVGQLRRYKLSEILG